MNESVPLLVNTLVALVYKSLVTVRGTRGEADHSAGDQNLRAVLRNMDIPLTLLRALASRFRRLLSNGMLRLNRRLQTFRNLQLNLDGWRLCECQNGFRLKQMLLWRARVSDRDRVRMLCGISGR